MVGAGRDTQTRLQAPSTAVTVLHPGDPGEQVSLGLVPVTPVSVFPAPHKHLWSLSAHHLHLTPLAARDPQAGSGPMDPPLSCPTVSTLAQRCDHGQGSIPPCRKRLGLFCSLESRGSLLIKLGNPTSLRRTVAAPRNMRYSCTVCALHTGPQPGVCVGCFCKLCPGGGCIRGRKGWLSNMHPPGGDTGPAGPQPPASCSCSRSLTSTGTGLRGR